MIYTKHRQFNFAPDNSEARQLLSVISETKASPVSRSVDRPLLALYGCGNLGRMARNYLAHFGFKLSFALDLKAEQYQQDPAWQGVSVLHPDEVAPEQRNSCLLAICVVTSPCIPLIKNLQTQGWSDCVPFYDIAEAYRDQHPLSNGWIAAPFTAVEIQNISTVLSGWSDNLSRAHHLQFLSWRRLREEWSFTDAPVTADDRFFIPEILSILNDHETFADFGAHTGSVAERFLKIKKGNFSRIWAIEPDQANMENLRKKISRMTPETRKRIQLKQTSVGSHPGASTFYYGLGYASQLSRLGQHKIKVNTIDELKLDPSYIKLHLEGAELDALKGAQKTILRHRPIITATTYHNDLGLWELPLWLMQKIPDYHFLLRLHSWCGTGSVIYCIPNERWQNLKI
ncbi:FkbM family methyltransferase [Desulfobacula sp.]|uniref:FkbM family methyltransferase n=1 Tax=Desulfobacula sp. TaxID=2593537 RepID=UPI00262551B1|nr:FkbM family methyltransferase [Desulfobacula sp.]